MSYSKPSVGFLDTVASISSIVATLASAGVTSYGAVRTLELAKKQADLSEDIARTRLKLEQQMTEAQIRIADAQTEGIEERNEIDIDLAKMQMEYAERQLERLDELDALRKGIEKSYLIEEQKEAASIGKTQTSNISDSGGSNFGIYAVLGASALVIFWLGKK